MLQHVDRGQTKIQVIDRVKQRGDRDIGRLRRWNGPEGRIALFALLAPFLVEWLFDWRRAAPLNLQSRRWSRARGDPSNEGIMIHLPTSHHGYEKVLRIPLSPDWNLNYWKRLLIPLDSNCLITSGRRRVAPPLIGPSLCLSAFAAACASPWIKVGTTDTAIQEISSNFGYFLLSQFLHFSHLSCTWVLQLLWCSWMNLTSYL